MSRLRELIDELCPDGVEYKALGDLATKIVDGSHKVPPKSNAIGALPMMSAQNVIGGRLDATFGRLVSPDAYAIEAQRTKAHRNDVLLTIVGAIGRTAVLETDDILAFQRSVCVITVDEKQLEPRFLRYALDTSTLQSYMASNARGAAQKGFYLAQVAELSIPVPPIEVQREVVRILDSFQELDEALTAEIEAREKQFDTCLSKLMHEASEDAAIVKLGSQMTVVRGASPRPIKSYLTTDSDGVHWIKIGDVAVGGKYVMDTAEYVTSDGAAKSRFLKSGSLILSNSMSFGRPYILGIDGCIHDGWLAMSGYESSYDRDFLYYLLRSDGVQTAWEMAASTSTVRNLNADIVRDTLVPLPNMDKQLEIARALDELMRLTDLLRSERDARRKQFEHYRDKLLSFPEKAVP